MNCSMRQEIEENKCTIPCEGIYADIFKHNGEIVDGTFPEMKDLFDAYEKYKNQFIDDIVYSTPGMKRTHTHIFNTCIEFLFQDYKFQTKLHFIGINFDTPTFDSILKVNLMLFISILYLFYYILKILN